MGLQTLAYGVLVANALYKSLSLVYVFLFLHDIPLHQILIHGIVAVASPIMVYWQYDLYWKNADVGAAFWTVSLTGNAADANVSSVEKTDDNRSWLSRISEESLQDLIAIFLPYMLLSAILVIGVCYALDPTMRLLLYSALRAKYQNWLSFGMCLVEEVRLLLIFLATVNPVWQVQIIAFDLISDNLERLIKSMTTESSSKVSKAENVYLHLRCLQMYITVLNIVNRYLIFTWKILSLGMCITSGYVAIAHFKEHPVFGVMYYVISFEGAVVYTLLYEKAIKVSMLFQRVKTLLRMNGNRLEIRAQRKLLDRRAMSIRPVGIKVGEFHTLERIMTPLFLHYILQNVMSMLVAYGGAEAADRK